jgi:4-amino-4-deoxy-L-arabinose transferase-like glycosyltransferase
MKITAPTASAGAMALTRESALAVAMILAFAAARAVFCLLLDFGIDEAYTLTLARRLSWSYFDHPPLHQWIAHFAALAFGENVAVRLPFIALFAATGWLIFALTRDLFDARAGLWAVFALNVTPFFFASAGGWIVPDGTLLFSLAAAAYALSRLLFQPAPSVWPRWLAVGFFIGLAGLSKYNAIFFPLGLVLFLALSAKERRWFIHPAPYCAALLALLIIAPVLLWNAENNWVSFLFQGGRGAPETHWRPAQVGAMLLSEIALLSPWIFIPLAAGVFTALRTIANGEDDGRRRLLVCLALPPIILFTLIPLWGARGLPHWPMPGWLFAYPLLGAWLGERAARWRSFAFGATAALTLIATLAVAQARTGFLINFFPRLADGADPTLESLAWSKLRQSPLLLNAGDGAFVVATKWTEAGKIAQALGPQRPIMVFSDDPRGFAFLEDPAAFIGKNAVIIVSQKRLAETTAALTPYFAALSETQFVSLGRDGRDELKLALIPAERFLRPYPLPYPRREGSR